MRLRIAFLSVARARGVFTRPADAVVMFGQPS
jgi:hypothetical protein